GQEEQLIAVKPTDNPQAYDAYLRGLAYVQRTARHRSTALARRNILEKQYALIQSLPLLGHSCRTLTRTATSPPCFNLPLLSARKHGRLRTPLSPYNRISAKPYWPRANTTMPA